MGRGPICPQFHIMLQLACIEYDEERERADGMVMIYEDKFVYISMVNDSVENTLLLNCKLQG